ncbi:EAL domain-containing protein [Sphingomonadaceae bacterium jetA1]|jgi:EAL domain-containing protein (putative c-di-GMP-specific phosphodiesterase class I)/GGDEF domain-containing protein|uniref:EAL domain-containing protein n=1 Tax=Facivitalis istanbulensis TaxID=3075838 RepID=UPI00348090F0
MLTPVNDRISRIATDPKAGDASETDLDGAGTVRWQFLILAAIGNFTLLRRRLGRDAAARLVDLFAERAAARLSDAVVRPTGAAEIEILLHAPVREALEPLLAELGAVLAGPYAVEDHSCRIEPVLGAASAALSHDDEVRLLEEAEHALADAQREGRAVVRDMADRIERFDKRVLARDLTLAVEQDGLFVEYQPKVHVRQQRVASIEALLRWRHPIHGLISPVEFIAVAEDSRIIAPLTLWILRRVIADQRRLVEAGHALRIFINISGMLLADRDFVREACALVTESGAQIGFEITETSVIRDPDTAITNLQTFVDIGIAVSIDDYGAGLSSLSYLKQLPACELKIDKLFITQLTSSHRDPLIVRSTIDLAHALEMEVVAEGVESPATLALLSVMGCDMVQGYLISRPIGWEALRRFLDEQAHRPVVAQARTMPFGHLSVHARG